MQQHRGSEANFYRSSAGAEIDQVQRLPGGDIWAIEIKRTTSPKVTRGFRIASEELGAAKRILVYANQEQVPGNGGILAMPLSAAMNRLSVLQPGRDSECQNLSNSGY